MYMHMKKKVIQMFMFSEGIMNETTINKKDLLQNVSGKLMKLSCNTVLVAI